MKHLWNATRNTPAVPELEVAETFAARLKGLLGRPSLPEARGLLLMDCNSIHMCCMRFAIDALFLDKDLRVVKVAADLKPWQLASCSAASHTLEIPAGAAARAGIAAGDQLSLVPNEVPEVKKA